MIDNIIIIGKGMKVATNSCKQNEQLTIKDRWQPILVIRNWVEGRERSFLTANISSYMKEVEAIL
jgi:hypothetical protein